MKTAIPTIVNKQIELWVLDAPSGETYDVVHLKLSNTWTIEEGVYNESADDWDFETIYHGPDFSPVSKLMHRCGVMQLVS